MRFRRAVVGVLTAVVLAGCVAGAPSPAGVQSGSSPGPGASQGDSRATPFPPPGTVAAATPLATPPGATAPTPEPTAPGIAADSATSPHTFIDGAHHTQLLVYLDPDVAHFGEFSFAAKGAGLFWNVRPATVDIAGEHSVTVRYEGAGTVDEAASLDFVFGLNRSSGSTQPVSIRLEAQIDPITSAATADLWTGGAHYSLVVRPPAHNADQALAAMLDAYRTEDWSALYDLFYSQVRTQVSRAEFVAQIAAAASGWPLVDAQVVSPITYGSGQAGFFTAVAQVRVTYSRLGATRTDLSQAVLLWENGAWALLTLGSGPTPAPS